MRRENSLEKSMMLGMGGGTRERGRPRARWLDDVKAVTNCTLTELCGLINKRSERLGEDGHGNHQKADAT